MHLEVDNCIVRRWRFANSEKHKCPSFGRGDDPQTGILANNVLCCPRCVSTNCSTKRVTVFAVDNLELLSILQLL